MREVRMVAEALAGEYGSLLRIADEARFMIKRVPLAEARAVYFPPDSSRPRGLLILAKTVSADRDHYLALALAHHFLRHRTFDCYTYDRTGAMYPSPREELEAETFAEHVRARCQPAPNVVPLRARLPG